MKLCSAFFLLFTLLVSGCPQLEGDEGNLLRDLMIVTDCNARIYDRLPVTFNHLLQGGYFNMPSARMAQDGDMGFGYSYLPPYRLYNLRWQILERVELSGNYRVFKDVDDPILTPFGFGDFSDKGANIKLSLFSPEDSGYRLPGISIGLEDFIGTRAFKSRYIVFTQVLINYNFEISLGYGADRIRGFFGGATWFPFHRHPSPWLKGLSVCMEYDATPYRDPKIERHDKGRVKKNALNAGLKYRLFDSFDFSVAYIRGDAWAFSASGYYNFGYTKGLVPKIRDPQPYMAPTNTEGIGYLRPEEVVVHDFIYAFQSQCLDVLDIWLIDEPCRTLRVKILNIIYREEYMLRNRISEILGAITPENVDKVIVVIEGFGFPVQEYHYNREALREYNDGEIGRYQLNIMSPMREVSWFNTCLSKRIFYKKKPLWMFEILPKTHTLFGSSTGKFKYAFGVSWGLDGFLYQDVFYTIRFGYFALSNLYDLQSTDRLNPSQLINVRTDIINYYKETAVTVDQAYLQKINNWGNGFFTRVAVGHFEQEYGGLAGEFLYYPLNSHWAVGLEGAAVRKRTLSGIGFSDKVRKLDGFVPHYEFFRGSQYFANVYYDWKDLALSFKVSAGKFLANDKGARFEVSRYFPSGLRLTFWYTRTNGHDKVNGHTYYDKGVCFAMPLDILFLESSRSYWGYGMSAWLRDVGVKALTGAELYYLINDFRE